MKSSFHEDGWEDYLYWRRTDRKILKRIKALIREAARTPHAGTGKPEPLKHALSGSWSRRIAEEHRLIYCVEEDFLVILQCRYHY